MRLTWILDGWILVLAHRFLLSFYQSYFLLPGYQSKSHVLNRVNHTKGKWVQWWMWTIPDFSVIQQKENEVCAWFDMVFAMGAL
mmetsp:Transcript_6672/g.13993  ORF Transcript_6672/g.13993 Transcript_6672/m.13993 type:complete len:84 (-) Transcript_6672:224-475(-)